METKTLSEQFEEAKPGLFKHLLTKEEQAKASELAKRIHLDSRCSKEEATRVSIEYVKKFGTV